MAQPATTESPKVLVGVGELHEARTAVKRAKDAAQEADRKLAALEERLVGLDGQLARYGIALDLGGLAS